MTEPAVRIGTLFGATCSTWAVEGIFGVLFDECVGISGSESEESMWVVL